MKKREIIASTTVNENREFPALNFDLHQVCWFTVSQRFSVFKYNNVHLAWHSEIPLTSETFSASYEMNL